MRKWISVAGLTFLMSCGFATIADTEIIVGDYLKEFKVESVDARFLSTNSAVIELPEKMVGQVDLTKLAPVFKLNKARLYVDGVEQISGVTVNNFTKQVVYEARAIYTSDIQRYGIKVVFETAKVESFSNMIKVTDIMDGLVVFDFERSPVAGLVGVAGRDLKYCKSIVNSGHVLKAAIGDLVVDFPCSDFVSYYEILRQELTPTSDTTVINIVAKYQDKLYYYNRLLLVPGIKFDDSLTCSEFISKVNGNTLVMTKSFTEGCEELNPAIMGETYLNGNGFTIKGFNKTIFSYIANSYITNLNIEDVNVAGNIESVGGITNQMDFSLLENLNIKNVTVSANKLNSGGVAGTITDSFIINTKLFNINIISTNDQVGGICGIFIQNYPLCISKIYNTSINTLNISGIGSVGGLIGCSIPQADISLNKVSIDLANINGIGHIGGLIGLSFWDNNVINSYFAGKIVAENNGGGIFGGSSTGSIKNSYSYLLDSSVNGIIGYNYENPITQNLYSTNEDEFSTRLSDIDFTDELKFCGFDFENVWIMGSTKPELRR